MTIFTLNPRRFSHFTIEQKVSGGVVSPVKVSVGEIPAEIVHWLDDNPGCRMVVTRRPVRFPGAASFEGNGITTEIDVTEIHAIDDAHAVAFKLAFSDYIINSNGDL